MPRPVPPLAGSVGKHPDAAIVTQGHVLRVDHLLTTLAVEAAIYHLDMIIQLNRSVPHGALSRGLSAER
jgi:hypothetical protein